MSRVLKWKPQSRAFQSTWKQGTEDHARSQGKHARSKKIQFITSCSGAVLSDNTIAL